MATAYETVIGLEVHAQLLTRTKLFCGCQGGFGSDPNSQVCPVCLGLPGSLPVLSVEAVELAVRAALALGCTVHRRSVFARKNYFYPDLPKGYQISQYEQPYATGGGLEVETEAGVRRIALTRIHMEEDAGKTVHGVGGVSLVDLNRTGTPLIEIVSEPELRSSAEAAAYLRALREVLVAIAVNDGNLEEGSFRCDANVSIRPVGQTKLGTRCELKNLNSFRFVQRAIDAEVARQTAILDAGGVVVQETRSFDPETGRTATLRSKEDAHDYRYFPDPDLPPLLLDDELIEAARQRVGELPAARRERYRGALGLSADDATTLTQHPAVSSLFDEVCRTFDHPKKVANWILTEVLRGARIHGIQADLPVSAGQLAELLSLVERGDISGKQAKEVYVAIEGTARMPSAVVEERGLRVVSDEGALIEVVRQVLADSPTQVAQYRAGKKGVTGYFVGQIMKRTQGSADPKLVNQLLARLLEEPS